MLTGLASSWDGTLVARRRFGTDARGRQYQDPVQVWDLASGRLVAEFPTIHESGGSRLAVSRDGTVLVAAAFSRRGVAAYDIDSGKLRWHRKDVRQIQRLAIQASDRGVWCVCDRGPARLLDTATGATLDELRAARAIFVDAEGGSALVFDGRKYWVFDRPGRSFGASLNRPLDCGFGDTLVVVSEVTGPMRCFDRNTGSELYRAMPEKGTHWTSVGFVAGQHRFALVTYAYERGGPRFLDEFKPSTDRLTRIAPVPSPTYVFCRRGSLMLGTRGDLRTTHDGQPVHEFRWWSEDQGEYR